MSSKKIIFFAMLITFLFSTVIFDAGCGGSQKKVDKQTINKHSNKDFEELDKERETEMER